MTTTVTLNADLLKVLWACHAYWLTEPVPVEQRSVCFSWVEGKYRDRFGGTFHQSMLATLAKLGFLVPDDTSRGGKRRYYRLSDPQAIRELVAEFDLA
jgi:hypothetical protein